MSDKPWTSIDGGLLLSVRLTPKGGRDAIDGVEALADGRLVLKARVKVPPEEGQANAALIKLIAQSCNLPASRVSVQSGHTARLKILRIEGESATLIEAMIAAVSVK